MIASFLVQMSLVILKPRSRNLLSNCIYSMTCWSFLSLDDQWSTGYHYADLFRPSALCDPQFLHLDLLERRNYSVWKGIVTKITTNKLQWSWWLYRAQHELMFLFGFAVCGEPSVLQATQRGHCQSCMLETQSATPQISCFMLTLAVYLYFSPSHCVYVCYIITVWCSFFLFDHLQSWQLMIEAFCFKICSFISCIPLTLY